MQKFALTLLLIFPVLAVSSGCKPKVDCNKLEERLTSCMVENYKALNKKGRDIEKPEYLADRNKLAAKYTEIIDKEIVSKCKAAGGKDVRASKINKCLKFKSCLKVHACLKHVLK